MTIPIHRLFTLQWSPHEEWSPALHLTHQTFFPCHLLHPILPLVLTHQYFYSSLFQCTASNNGADDISDNLSCFSPSTVLHHQAATWTCALNLISLVLYSQALPLSQFISPPHPFLTLSHTLPFLTLNHSHPVSYGCLGPISTLASCFLQKPYYIRQNSTQSNIIFYKGVGSQLQESDKWGISSTASKCADSLQ